MCCPLGDLSHAPKPAVATLSSLSPCVSDRKTHARVPLLDSDTPLRIIDESLYDADADRGESLNLAYYGSHSHTRYRLLQAALREWNVSARVWSPLNESRWQRAEWLRARTGFRRDWWKR